MKPQHVDVTLSDDNKATVSLFDIEFMILSLLTDESLMKEETFAPGYDIYTGEVEEQHPHNQNYGRYTLGMRGKARATTIVALKRNTCILH